MDISNEASVYPFAIGPFTILGRTVAFKILFCNSVERLRHGLSDTVAGYFNDFMKILKPHCSWRKPQTVLVIVTVLAFLLKRLTNVKSRAEKACRRKFWSNMMKTALTYEEWANAATMSDKGKRRGGNSKTSESDLYDEELVRNKLRELQHRRKDGSLRDIMFYMRADLFRNLGNMCNPDLHKGRLQVPKLIKEYIDEVSEQLRMVCVSESDEQFQLEEKLSFMHETRHAFGRTALLLSGGASLGAFHVGVVRTLVEHKLLPRIIAGTSAGSVICAIVGTQSSSELQNFDESWYTLKFFGQLGGIFTVVKRVMSGGAVHEIRHLQMLLRNLTNNLTFQEAYDVTGRILGITVCSPRKHEPPRCLNYLTSPHVVIWSAVTASCAFPGLFEAQELMAKNRSGELVPYHPPFHLDPEEGAAMPPRRWRDGGLEMDLPKMQLKELFNVNHFIVSQANPHASAVLRLKEFARAYGGNFAVKLVEVAEMEVKHRCSQMLELGFPFQGIMKVMKQDWEGDITVVVHATPLQYTRIIQNPSCVEIQKAVNQGRRCVWEKLSAIRSNCDIELALDECVSVLNHVRRLPSGGGGAVPCRRIPSWNCIARERSAGSLEERIVPGVVHHDISEGESEMADLHSWTQTGGPLMRTTSANRFVEFIQTLDGGEVNGESPETATSSRIGIVVRREDPNVSDQCDKQLDAAEYLQLDCSDNESGDSSAADDAAADSCVPICPLR